MNASPSITDRERTVPSDQRLISVTDRERTVPSDQRLISVTDEQGAITYCNREFAAMSGYTPEQLIGKPHSIITHPYMPAAISDNMFSHLKAGKSWMGIVKNRCSNGDYYWTSAYVTPIFENGRITGFESVRVKPETNQVRRALTLYARLQSRRSESSVQERIRAAADWLLAPAIAGAALLAISVQGYQSLSFGIALGLLLGQAALSRFEVARQGNLEANAGLQQVIETQQALTGITEAIDRIDQMAQQMSAASEEQACVADDISRQITRIAQVSDQNAELAVGSSAIGRDLERTAASLHVLVERFNS